MSVESALTSAGRLVARRFPALLPFYLLVTAAADVARLPLLAAAAAAYVHLDALGRLDPVVRDLLALNPERLDPADPTTLPPGLESSVASLVTPTVVGLFGVAVVLSVVLFLVVRAVAAAGTFSAVDAGLRDVDPLTAGVDGLATHWRTFVGLAVVRWSALAVSALPGLLGTVAAASLGPVGAVLAFVGGVVTVFLLLVVVLAFAFVGPAVVVDDVGVGAAVRRSVAVPRHRPGEFLLYVLLVVAVGIGVGVVGAGLAFVGVPRVATLLTAVVVAPLLDGFAVAVYAERVLPASTDRPPFGRRVAGAVREGVGALASFVRTHPGSVLGGLGTLVVGLGVGWTATAGYGVSLSPPGDPASVFGPVPLGPFLNIAVNNWLVASGGALAGLGLGLPTAGMLLFNGILVGAIAGVVERTAFLALVAPHGVLELPAIGVAGGLGLHLGRVGLRALRGRTTADEVSAELERAASVLVGLAVVFAVAAFVEAFVTPHVAAAVLG